MVRSTRATTTFVAMALGAALAVGALLALGRPRAALDEPGGGAALPAADAPALFSEWRIVSLSPAITRTLVGLGLGDRIVGRTPWCEWVPPDVPIVGSLQDYDAERIVRLHPTHVLVQPPAAGIDPGLAALVDANGWRIASFPLNGLDDIDAMLAALPAALAPPGAPSRAALEANVSRLRGEMAAALAGWDRDDPAVTGPGRTLWLFSIDPPMAFGRGSYFDDVLARIGMVNAIDVKGYPELSLEDIHRAQPDTIVLVRDATPASNAALATNEAALRRLLGTLETPASRSGRIWLFADPNAMTPGAGVIDLARALRAFLETHAGPAPRGGDRP